MKPRERTHLINTLMEEANLMMGVLEKSMQAQQQEAHQVEASHHITDDEPHPPSAHTLEQEHAAWEQICMSLHEIQTALDQIDAYEQERIERLTPSV